MASDSGGSPALWHAFACVAFQIRIIRTSGLKINNSYTIQSAPCCILVAAIAKAGIITGMIFAGFVMIMLGIAILPNAIDGYDRNQVLNKSDEELEKIFTESKEYAAFAERFPDHAAEFSRGSHDARFQMGALNPETGNALVMYLYYNEYDGPRIDKDIRCEYVVTDEGDRYEHQNYADGVLVKLYIENTKCLD